MGALAVVALFVNEALAGLLAGVLGGMGMTAVIVRGGLAMRERREGLRLYVERGARPRRFVARI